MEIKIEGMKCPRCAAAVEKALENAGGKDVRVDLENKCAYVTSDDEAAMKKAVTDAGYEVK